MSMWDEVKKNLTEWYSVTSDKTSEVARITSLRYDKFGISRDIERQLSELGNIVYTGLKEGREDLLVDPAVQALMTRLEDLEGELADKEAQVASIRDGAGRRKAAAAAGSSATETEPPTLITDPVLDRGRSQSAILVEPPVSETEPPVNPEETGPEIPR